MFDKDAIKELAMAQAITAGSDASAAHLAKDQIPPIALPQDFNLHDLERYAPTRRRARGTVSTSVAADFAQYADAHKEHGSTVFVDADAMTATAVLNLGDPEIPGHADNEVVLKLRQTAPFIALLTIANGRGFKQSDVAEFIEDWASHISCFNTDGGSIDTRQAIAAVRRITIESLRKVESDEQQLSATRSALESVKATASEPIPAAIVFRCEPYQGLSLRPFAMRLGILTGDKVPLLVLRIQKMEDHKEQMAKELVALVADAIKDSMPVHIGTYVAKK